MTRQTAKLKPEAASPALARRAAMKAKSGVEPKKASAPQQPDYPITKGRKALKGVSIYMHPLAKDTLDKIAREQGRSRQDLCIEALNLLFRHHGEKPIA
jgi:hypothetical protein